MIADGDHADWSSLVLLERYRAGDDRAADEIFGRYFHRLTALARSRVAPRLAQRTDPEDIVLSVYRSFFVDARAGRFALGRGGDLWRLLAAITKRKLLRQVRAQNADRRAVDVEIPLKCVDERHLTARAHEPTPEEALALADELEEILSRLDAFGCRVLELRLQGLQLTEIAQDTGRSERSVRRALAEIRRVLGERSGDACEAEDADADEANRDDRAISPATGPVRIANVDLRGPLLAHDDFHLVRLIGAGRMGKVYEANQRGSEERVAVKFLRKTFLSDANLVRRFIGEARTVAKLRHPNIVGTQGLGRTPGGSYFIVMDLVNGPNLAEVARERTIGIEEAVRWVLDACGALEHAHEHGVVHCDLKPANLLCDATGRIRVTDFGLARSLVEDTPWASELEGTLPFMAPEQAASCWGPIDCRTDVYGLGAVLFTLLAGRPPIVGRRLPDILAEAASAKPIVSPATIRPDIPAAVGDVCCKCLAKTPGERFASIRELRSALVRL
jgi:tRNA A-37 threonylcarbamoyl transferase component Bud32/DNA-directed RNA polymerase specialized sigma24 family protein